MRTLFAVGLVACFGCTGSDAVEGDVAAGESGILDEGTVEAIAVLAFLNGREATLEVLDDEVPLESRAARNIVDHIDGPDHTRGTDDDDPLDTIAELDAIPYVGPSAMERLLAYVASLGLIPDRIVEGVALTEEQIADILAVANGATLYELDEEARLDARAARNIVAERPFATIEELADVSYVGATAIGLLRDYAASWSGPMPVDDACDGSYAGGADESVLAIGGRILLPGGSVDGWVIVRGRLIVDVVTSAAGIPAGARRVDTGGIVSPGLIDLHNHVNYDFIPIWDAGRRFSNRYQWARTADYERAVKDPYNAVKDARHMCQAIKYGEFRALVGGTTTIQGTTDYTCTRSWVRNVEHKMFCEDHVRQNVLPINSFGEDYAAGLVSQFESGETSAFLVHLAEGIDDSSRFELEQLRSLDLLRPQVVGIHSTALTEAQIEEMGDIGMKIVWSPLSNLILYGRTTNVPAALRHGVPVALAPDWSPSGSANLLGELKVAERVDAELFGNVLSDEDLWRMATSIPAEIADMSEEIGSIGIGTYADLLVVRGDRARPHRAIVTAEPADVLLTVVNGEPLYGDTEILDALGKDGQYQIVDACGEPRGLDTIEEDPEVVGGDETLDEIVNTIHGDGVADIIPLFQCDPPPEWMFEGAVGPGGI